ncbi:hypothetical protein AVEN_154012-1 [Araneus ventricosus]|uniref:Uncharacterized protein n=1 Tax=Araneus ventricosus TaxID=182803 RepID=A0A4Y2MQW0_ARAVE|nr:hypothetical protein AVEN_154012-1 [Araneus ventricosus]
MKHHSSYQNLSSKHSYVRKMRAIWQMDWDDGDTGRLIHNIIHKVSLQPFNWTRNEVFFTDGSFPSYLQRFYLDEISLCTCEGIGTPINYATDYLLPYGNTQTTTSGSLVH